MNGKSSRISLQLLPVFFCFAVMGFIDITGVATNFVKQDFGLSDRMANLLPSMTMIWFLIISIPTAGLMNRIGRKPTVLLSLAVMAVALVLPLFGYGVSVIFAAFALLGIGNTILQVSLNPLLKNIVADDRMTSALSFGQFTKSVISLLGPVLIGFFATRAGSWTVIFYVYAAAMVLALVWLWLTPIPKESSRTVTGSFSSAFSLLRDPYIAVCFTVIVMIVGFEICLMTVVPKQLLESFGMPIEEGGLGCSIYYATKTAGTFIGALLLAKLSAKTFLKWTSAFLVLFFALYFFAGASWQVFVLLALIGLAGANIFAIVFSLAMSRRPESSNDVSALMIAGIAGGALLPPLMGLLSDAAGTTASLAVPLAAALLVLASAFYVGKGDK